MHTIARWVSLLLLSFAFASSAFAGGVNREPFMATFNNGADTTVTINADMNTDEIVAIDWQQMYVMANFSTITGPTTARICLLIKNPDVGNYVLYECASTEAAPVLQKQFFGGSPGSIRRISRWAIT